MNSASAEPRGRHATNCPIEAYMQIRKLSVSTAASSQLSVTELELNASHTSDPNHLNPSCHDCRRLRSQLTSIARPGLEQIAGMSTEIGFKTHTDPGILCSLADGQRPFVMVSIFVCQSLLRPANNTKALDISASSPCAAPIP